MNMYAKITRGHSILIILSSVFLTSFPANAAIYDMEESLLLEGSKLNESFFNIDMLELHQHQSMDQVNSNYQLVLELVMQKKYAEAKEKVASLIEQNPKQSIYYNLKAIMAYLEKDLVLAEQNFQKAVELSSGNFQAYTGLAILALEGKKFIQAEKYAYTALKIYPYQVNAYEVLADVALQKQGINAKEKMLLDANAKVKGNLKAELGVLKLLGKVYDRKKQPNKLLLLAEDLVDRNKHNSSALSFLVGAQLMNQNLLEAEQSLRQIISQDPKDAKHRVLLARLLSTQAGKETEVLQLLDQAEVNLENPIYVLAFKATFLTKQKKYHQALAVARQVDKSYPKLSTGKVITGDVYSAENKYTEALQSYQLAYQILPNTKVLDNILKILIVQNKQQDAIELLENEFAKNKDNAAIQLRLARLYQKAGHYDLSIKHYEALLTKQEDNVIVLNNIARLYNYQKNPKALKWAKKAYQKAPNSAVIADTYGYILLKNGSKQEGLKVLKEAAKIAPDMPTIQLHLAEAYSVNQNKPQAKEILQNLVKKNGAEKAAAIKLMGQL